MKLTRREKHVLFIAALVLIGFAIAGSLAPSMQAFNLRVAEWEPFFLLVIVAPLGFYLALDPERKRTN